MFWGSLSDRIGRKKVLIFGNAGTLLSLLVVGFSPSFGVALLGRVFGGLLNGNVGVIQVCILYLEASISLTNADRQWLESWLPIRPMNVSYVVQLAKADSPYPLLTQR
jgi:MFS family permease